MMPLAPYTMGLDRSHIKEIAPEIKLTTYAKVDGTIVGKCYMRYGRRQRHQFSYGVIPFYTFRKCPGHDAFMVTGDR